MYDLYIEKQRADINQTLSIQLSYAIDDIRQFGTRNTSFSKSITLPGTAKNNKLFGHILTNTGANPYSVATPNIDLNFNPADISLCEVRTRGLLVLKGIFRLTGYKLNNGVYEYEGTIFGELGGFVSAIGNSRLQDLDFSEYDHVYNTTNIVNSWDSINGSGYYYPLIDYGTYSAAKVNYDIRTFRPALYAKEYIDKIFEAAGYTYESTFFNTSFFKSIIIPHNTKNLERLDSRLLTGTKTNLQSFTGPGFVGYDTATGGNFVITSANSSFQWNSSSLYVSISVDVIGSYINAGDNFNLGISINGTYVVFSSYAATAVERLIFTTFNFSTTLNNGDIIRISLEKSGPGGFTVDISESLIIIETSPPTTVIVDVTENVNVNQVIPRGIFQKDFFSWILRQFNLYVDEDKLKDKHLLIEPYIDYYDYATRLDWSQKIDYSKTLSFEPMGQLNGRFFEYKYTPDNDFYNESYQKKFNQSYGDILYDTGFPFSKDKQTVEIGFSPTPLVKYTGTDKTVPAIYKKSKGNDIDQEELTDSNIRILLAKKITGVASWNILDKAVVLSSQTVYGYAGHLDDPTAPTKDLNFGVPSEIYFTVSAYTGNGLFNVYWNSYIQEIANKDSKILSCHAYLKGNDIADLDFSKPIYISGSLWRINKIEDYDAENPVTRVELLKIINADNG